MGITINKQEMAKARKGWEKHRFYGKVLGELVTGTPLGELTSTQLQAILDSDPKNASNMIDGRAGAVPKRDSKPEKELPKAPEE